MEEVSTERTLPLIAAEINLIRHQTEKTLLAGAIEIGRRLKEARDRSSYGEWGKWLEESVNYSQKTADKLMSVFDAYGSWNAAAVEEGSEVQALPAMNFTQAYILLGVPEEEREEFLAEIDVEGMSTRELQKAVNDRSQAIKERDQALQENSELQKTLEKQSDQINQLSAKRDSLEAEAEELKASNVTYQATALAMKKKLEESHQDPESAGKLKRALLAESLKNRCIKVAFLCEQLTNTFNSLMWEMKILSNEDPVAHKEYQKKVRYILSCSRKKVREEKKQADQSDQPEKKPE